MWSAFNASTALNQLLKLNVFWMSFVIFDITFNICLFEVFWFIHSQSFISFWLYCKCGYPCLHYRVPDRADDSPAFACALVYPVLSVDDIYCCAVCNKCVCVHITFRCDYLNSSTDLTLLLILHLQLLSFILGVLIALDFLDTRWFCILQLFSFLLVFVLEILTTAILFLRLGLGLCNLDQRRFALALVGLFLVLVVLLTKDMLLLLLLLLNCLITDDNEGIFLSYSRTLFILF